MAKEDVIEYSGTDKDKEGNTSEFSGQVIFKMPDSTDEAVQMWGDEVCLSKIVQAVTIDVQRVCRAAKDSDKAQEAVSKYIPGVSRRNATGGISQAALVKKLKALDPEKLKEFLAMIG